MSSLEVLGNKTKLSKDLVSVVIPCYFSKTKNVNLLSSCIESILMCTYDKLEIIVVNDGSPVEFFSKLDQKHRDKVTFLSYKENRGYSYACNTGALKASGEFICFLNDDMRVDPRMFEILVKKLNQDKLIGIVACREVEYDSNSSTRSAGMLMDRFMNTYARSRSESGPFFYAPGSPSFMRNDLFRNIGGFDEDYYLFVEDVDLNWRARMAGYKITYEESAVVNHVGSVTLGQFNARRIYYTERNGLTTLIKNFGTRMMILCAILFCTQLIMMTVVALIQGWRDIAIVLSKSAVDNIKKFRSTWRKRRIIQSRRKVDDSWIRPYLWKGWLLVTGNRVESYRRRLRAARELQKATLIR